MKRIVLFVAILCKSYIFFPCLSNCQFTFGSNLVYSILDDPLVGLTTPRYNYEQCVRACNLNSTCVKNCKIGGSVPAPAGRYPSYGESEIVKTYSNVSYQDAINSINRYVRHIYQAPIRNLSYLPYYEYIHSPIFPQNSSWKVCAAWAALITYNDNLQNFQSSVIWECSDRF